MTAEEASAAKNMHTGASIDGRVIGIDYGKKICDSQARHLTRRPNAPTKTLVFRNLACRTTEHGLLKALGSATAARVITDKTTGLSKG